MRKLQTVFEKASTDEIDKFHANTTKEKKATTVVLESFNRELKSFNPLYTKLQPNI